MKHTLTALTIVLMLSGCVTQQQRIAQSYQADLGTARAACSEKLKTPVIDSLRNRIVINIGQEPTLAMLSDESRPSDNEKASIPTIDEIHSACNQAVIDVVRKHYHPEYAMLATEVAQALRANLAELYSGRITYGQYNRAEQAVKIALNSRIQDLNMKHQQLQAAEDQRLIGTLMLLNSMQPRAPINTTCSQLGNFVNCQTR